MFAVQAKALVKTYGSTTALDGVDLEIPPGKVLGLLGPNGAGKTTTVRILTTLLHPDSGDAEVAGHDVLTQPDAVFGRTTSDLVMLMFAWALSWVGAWIGLVARSVEVAQSAGLM